MDAASAGDFARKINRYFPDARISFEPNEARQALVDSWPRDVDCSSARRDWGFKQRWGFEAAMEEYIIPAIRKHYDIPVTGRTNP